MNLFNGEVYPAAPINKGAPTATQHHQSLAPLDCGIQLAALLDQRAWPVPFLISKMQSAVYPMVKPSLQPCSPSGHSLHPCLISEDSMSPCLTSKPSLWPHLDTISTITT